MPNDDRRLVRRCLEGDRSAFDALYDRHAARVYNLLHRLTDDSTLAEDLTQETFVTAYDSLGSWRGTGAFGTWLCGIACRQAANHRRRDGRIKIEPLEDERRPILSDSDPLASCTQQEAVRRMEAAIASLPPLSREAFVLVKVEGLSYREAAECIRIPLGTLQSRLWRAVCHLQAALAEETEHAVT